MITANQIKDAMQRGMIAGRNLSEMARFHRENYELFSMVNKNAAKGAGTPKAANTKYNIKIVPYYSVIVKEGEQNGM